MFIISIVMNFSHSQQSLGGITTSYDFPLRHFNMLFIHRHLLHAAKGLWVSHEFSSRTLSFLLSCKKSIAGLVCNNNKYLAATFHKCRINYGFIPAVLCLSLRARKQKRGCGTIIFMHQCTLVGGNKGVSYLKHKDKSMQSCVLYKFVHLSR